ncbi:hypothetical protein WN943_015516 [Citrus x changshan-huyou]
MTLRLSRVFREADGEVDCLSNLGAVVDSFTCQLLIAIRGREVNCLHHEHPENYDVCLSFRVFKKRLLIRKKFLKENIKKVQKWRGTLNESDFIMEIVNEISSKIPLKSETLKELVGMDSHFEKLTILKDKGPNDVRMIGICDMGGIGTEVVECMVYDFSELKVHSMDIFTSFSELKIVSRDHGTYGTYVGALIIGNCYKRIINVN